MTLERLESSPVGAPLAPILVLDDDPDLLKMVERVLAHDGRSVVTATDPVAALELYERARPCLVVVDLMLPHMDGEEFLQALVRRFGDPRPPVIILSASAVRSEVASRVGAEASLGKPFEIDDLRDMVARFCDAPA
jgi:CheY-like chemotaxis protein